MSWERAKDAAAHAAVAHVKDGMTVGLGSGSTAGCFVRHLAQHVRAQGWNIRCVPTSGETAALAQAEGLVLAESFKDALDVAVDGADVLDPQLRMIKGGGGFLLREKLVAEASRHRVCIIDARKLVAQLGGFPLPVEILPFGQEITREAVRRVLEGIQKDVELSWRDGVTDNGHVILDCALGSIPEPEALAQALERIPGVVCHGLFLHHADVCLVADEAGAVRTYHRGEPLHIPATGV